jgi:hypothetical protein
LRGRLGLASHAPEHFLANAFGRHSEFRENASGNFHETGWTAKKEQLVSQIGNGSLDKVTIEMAAIASPFQTGL